MTEGAARDHDYYYSVNLSSISNPFLKLLKQNRFRCNMQRWASLRQVDFHGFILLPLVFAHCWASGAFCLSRASFFLRLSAWTKSAAFSALCLEDEAVEDFTTSYTALINLTHYSNRDNRKPFFCFLCNLLFLCKCCCFLYQLLNWVYKFLKPL